MVRRSENTADKTTDSGDSKQKKGKPPDEDAKKATSDTTAHKATFKVKQLLDGEVLKHKLPAKKPQPAKLAPLKEVQLPKRDDKETSVHSIYNTFLTEHFENAQITHIANFKRLDLAAAFAPTQEHTQPRSTEEMRGDTLYKVLDDFPDLIMPPMVDIDRSLPYLRELKVEATPCPSPTAQEHGAAGRTLKALLTPLGCIGMLDFYDIKKLRQTQSEEEGEFDASQSHAQMSNGGQVQTAPKEEVPPAVAPTEPEHIPPTPATTAEAKVSTTQSKPQEEGPSPAPRRRTTLRLRNPVALLRKLLTSREHVPPEKKDK